MHFRGKYIYLIVTSDALTAKARLQTSRRITFDLVARLYTWQEKGLQRRTVHKH